MIVIGYTADQFGHAALEHGIAEAKLRSVPPDRVEVRGAVPGPSQQSAPNGTCRRPPARVRAHR